jgi:hypothetical protein
MHLRRVHKRTPRPCDHAGPFESPKFLDWLSLDELRVTLQAIDITQRVMEEMQAKHANAK